MEVDEKNEDRPKCEAIAKDQVNPIAKNTIWAYPSYISRDAPEQGKKS